MTRTFGACGGSQAIATARGVAPSRYATVSRALDCNGLKPPNGQNAV